MILIGRSRQVIDCANCVDAGSAYGGIDRRVFPRQRISWRRRATSGAGDDGAGVRVFMNVEIIICDWKLPFNLYVDQLSGPVCRGATYG